MRPICRPSLCDPRLVSVDPSGIPYRACHPHVSVPFSTQHLYCLPVSQGRGQDAQLGTQKVGGAYVSVVSCSRMTMVASTQFDGNIWRRVTMALATSSSIP
jgi:hypothetical protein